MDITVWEGITNNFKIEVIHFMVNTSNKFTVYNSNIEIQKVVNLHTPSDFPICLNLFATTINS